MDKISQKIIIKQEPNIELSEWTQFYSAAMRGRHKIPSLIYSRPKCNSPDMKYICEVCHAELQSKQLLDKHKLCHFNTSIVCYACDFTTTLGARSMAAHMGQHDQLNPLARNLVDNKQGFICPVCLQKFATDNTIANHWAKHIQQEKLACKLCIIDFTSLIELNKHLSNDNHADVKLKMQNTFVCCDCHAIFSTRDSYAMHMMVRAQNETCKNAQSNGSMFPSPFYQSSSKTIPESMCNDSILSCINKIATQALLMKRSSKNLSNERTTIPRRESFPQLRNSIKNNHNQTFRTRSLSPAGNNETDQRQQFCRTCNLNFDNLFQHIRSYHLNMDEKPIICNCQLIFDTEFALNLHKKKRQCEIKRSSRKRKLMPRIYEKINPDDENNDVVGAILNENNKLFACKFCKIFFVYRTVHQLHMGLHNVNNPWQCNLCGKISLNVNDFTSHIVTSLHY